MRKTDLDISTQTPIIEGPPVSRQLRLAKVSAAEPVPKYRQARAILVEAIRSGQLAPGAKLPSTKEISEAVNVSLLTAHRALEEMVELGFLRREVGRGTFVCDDVAPGGNVKRDLSIGLILEQHERTNIDDYYHSTLINGLRREARRDEQNVEFFFQDKLDLRGRSRRTNVGAICVHPTADNADAVERLAKRRPVVVLGGNLPGKAVSCVDCDNEQGAREAIRHLVTLGHRRFLVISGPTELSNSRDRTEAAVAELSAQGIRLGDRNLLVSQDSVILDEGAKARIEKRLREADAPTAIFAGGYYLAMAAMHAVRGANLTIPGDVSVIGFDDPASATLLDPPLTTVRQPLEAMAARAYAAIRDALTGGTLAPGCEKLAPELIVRRSTAPARDRV